MSRGIFILLTFGLFSGMAAYGSLTLVLTPGTQNAAAGTETVFSGTLTNTSATNQIFLNDLQISGGAAALQLDANTFFANVPGILLPGETYTGPLFAVVLGAGASPADYAATVTIFGGGDIFAPGTLASATFAVLSPAVGVAATTPNASEFGPMSGVFTITRTGRTDLDLSVPYGITGSAANGGDYVAIGTAATILSGSSSAFVTITPIPDNLAEGDRTVTLTLKPAPTFNLDVNTSASVTIHDKPADQWRWQIFGAAANSPEAADDGDWDGDGIPNLVEYALGLDPKTPATAALPAATVAGGYFTISYVPNPSAIDVAYVVEASIDLAGWSTNHIESVAPADPHPPGTVAFRYNVPVAVTPEVFLRLRVNRLAAP